MNHIKLVQGTETSLPLFSWVLMENCNYDCPYCSEGRIKIHSSNQDIIQNFLIRLKELQAIDFQFNIEMLGGELTILPIKINEIIIKKISSLKNLVDFSFITNGSADLDYYKKLLEVSPKFYFIFSYHPFGVKIEDFVKKILDLNNKRIIPSFNLPLIYNKKLHEHILKIKDKGILYYINILTNKNGKILDYRDDIILKYDDIIRGSVRYRFDNADEPENPAFEFLKRNNENKGIICQPKFIDIHYKQGIHNKCRSDGQFYGGYIKCSKEACDCYQMINYPKYKDE